MKVELTEFEGCFAFDVEAETKEEVVKLARFGTGRTRELRNALAYFDTNGTATASIVIGKKKSGTGAL